MVVDFTTIPSTAIRPSKLAHVVLRTADKTAMGKFYVDFLGGFVAHENEVLSFITYDDEHHRIALAEIPSLKPKDRNTCGLEVGMLAACLECGLVMALRT
jgi:catechol-2,3-dioxygenase